MEHGVLTSFPNDPVTITNAFSNNAVHTQETNVIRKVVILSGATDNAATEMFTITTVDEAGSTDGGSYTVNINVMGSEAVANDGVNVSAVSLVAHFVRLMVAAGTGSNSAVAEISETASVDLGTGAIATITITVAETSEFVQSVLLQVDTSGGTFDGYAIVELVWEGFLTAPVISG